MDLVKQMKSFAFAILSIIYFCFPVTSANKFGLHQAAWQRCAEPGDNSHKSHKALKIFLSTTCSSSTDSSEVVMHALNLSDSIC